MVLTSVELCAGGGGQALGLEQAGFRHSAVVELDKHSILTLQKNRPHWNIIPADDADIRRWSGKPHAGTDLLAAGLPCPPFSKAGKQLGADDERNLFPAAIRIIEEIQPTAVMIENVRGLLDAVFGDFRQRFKSKVEKLGYTADWRLLNASDFGVPQLRPRVVFLWPFFSWPAPSGEIPKTVGEALLPLMCSRGWPGANEWKEKANVIAPTLVGGSHKHGGPDLGPTRAKRAWATLGVNGHLLADEPPGPDYVGMPTLTVEMCAILQGFPPEWKFAGRKTNAYRQVGNALPPPVAAAVGRAIKLALQGSSQIPKAA
jgi:DNA (cytosine-5)-methyltransferase 1